MASQQPIHRKVRESQGPAVSEVLGTQQIPLRRPDSAAALSRPSVGGQPRTQSMTAPIQQGQRTAAPGISPLPQSEKSHSETDSLYTPIELPSKFQFYSFKALSVRLLRGAEQAKFNRAYQENRIKYTVEAISATLEPGVSAFDLTPSDFYFLMYWQRVNSFTKSPQIISLICDNPEHVRRVMDPTVPEAEKLGPDTLQISEFLNGTTLDTTHLEELEFDSLVAGLEQYPLGVETMADIVALEELIQDSVEGKAQNDNAFNPEYGWLFSKACFLHRSLPIAKRIKIIEEMSVDDMALLETYIDKVTNYGVAEYGTVKCRGCGASKRVKIAFDALSFLPGS
jgi:hypothetical protein